ncbi:Alpha-aspartyl dipeptidase Peptidase E [Winogradskyella psychrotolerans RS-3]|uniref:dipeptidase E n=1 Tax=Winogradskyella psychrotolerans RS-3 TaxID=641526 RepID=S7X5B5_9FLAO|nr:dipeptidase PepE [Winogradskyella psychrotolerans]EPR74204.1 Alpha-aspartyl dipeptidase Peptidase E [Winogradskyella psychrotolerans RS-3]
MKSIIIASTSTIHGSGYLDYLLDELQGHFKSVNEILFIPYARPGGISHDDYTSIVSKAFNTIGKTVKGIHQFENAEEAVKNAQGIFVGGGNTFVLVSQLYRNKVLLPIKEAVKNGTPYLGTSAGSNICGLTMNTTNDMPIVYPPSFKTLGLVPFNINPHYLDPMEGSTHMGETRETRIKEFHAYNNQPVIGLREGSWIAVEGDKLTLKGTLKARIFQHNKEPYEIATNTDLGFLK